MCRGPNPFHSGTLQNLPFLPIFAVGAGASHSPPLLPWLQIPRERLLHLELDLGGAQATNGQVVSGNILHSQLLLACKEREEAPVAQDLSAAKASPNSAEGGTWEPEFTFPSSRLFLRYLFWCQNWTWTNHAECQYLIPAWDQAPKILRWLVPGLISLCINPSQLSPHFHLPHISWEASLLQVSQQASTLCHSVCAAALWQAGQHPASSPGKGWVWWCAVSMIHTLTKTAAKGLLLQVRVTGVR